MTLIALSAAYGAGGSVIGRELADRLGVPFVDRAIPAAVAQQLDVSVDHAAAHDEETTPQSFLDRVLRSFIATDDFSPTPVTAETFTSEDFREATEEVLLRQAATGEGVILGRASVIVLRNEPGALRVRLDGPAEARVRRAMTLLGIDEEAGRKAVRQMDRTHADYARQFYGMDIHDPSLYQLMIESTAFTTDVCVELIMSAARALAHYS